MWVVTYHPPGPPGGGQGPGSAGPDPFGGAPFGVGPQFGPATGPPVYTNTAAGPGPQRPVNTLATMSVIFAFVFAPVGAVLGHLGLSAIARTGERGRDRALIGLVLSYAVIVLAVIALVVSSVHDTGTAPPVSHPATPPASGSETPAAGAHGPIGAPLLGVAEITQVLNNPVPGAPTPPALTNFTATSVFSSPLTAGAVGRVDPAACEPTRFAGTETALGGTGYRAVTGASMQGDGPYVPTAVTEVVVTYPDPAAAQRAVDAYIGHVEHCGANGHGKFTLTAPDGSPQGDWIGVSAGPPMSLFGMSYRMIHSQRFDFGTNAPPVPHGQFYVCTHVLAVKGASLIDVAMSGTGLFFQAIDVGRKIAAQIG